jgi:small-conductance mechanosensitive channel
LLPNRLSFNPEKGNRLRKSAIRIFLLLVLARILCAPNSRISAQSPAEPQTPPNLPTAQDVITFLNQNIDWYHQLLQEQQIATDPADMFFVDQNRQTGLEILRLAFDFARADAQWLTATGAPESQVQSSTPGRYQSLMRAAQSADAEVRQTQSELEADKKSLDTARGANRKKLQSEVDELQSELDLAQTRSNTLHELVQFVTGSSGTGGNLMVQIDQLQRSVPELQTTTGQSQAKSTTQATTPPRSENRHSVTSGALTLVEDLFTLSHQINTLNQRSQATSDLETVSTKLRAPLIASVSTIAQQGEQAAKQADTSDPAQLEQLKKQLDTLNAQFKQSAAVLLPLSKQQVLFDLYRSNLGRWRDVRRADYSADLKKLLLRLAIFGIVVIVVVILSGMWQRAVFRYVHDPRRRYQFLLLRRIVLWCAIAITVAFALASEIGSIATFAGLITAGIAVALQNLILAIAGYFFLIGKYGVRVGDRVQISGVTGDVIDIGLIRLHLMELGGTGIDRQPTGRIVVFSNAVVFQPSASFYKQIPGTNFVWHEVSLMLAPESDYDQVEQRVLGAVEKVYADYRENIEQQYRAMETTLNFITAAPKPHSQLRVTQSGLEVVVRYPVPLENALEIDDRITRELLHSLQQPPKLRLVGSGVPNIQPVPSPEKAA